MTLSEYIKYLESVMLEITSIPKKRLDYVNNYKGNKIKKIKNK